MRLDICVFQCHVNMYYGRTDKVTVGQLVGVRRELFSLEKVEFS